MKLSKIYKILIAITLVALLCIIIIFIINYVNSQYPESPPGHGWLHSNTHLDGDITGFGNTSSNNTTGISYNVTTTISLYSPQVLQNSTIILKSLVGNNYSYELQLNDINNVSIKKLTNNTIGDTPVNEYQINITFPLEYQIKPDQIMIMEIDLWRDYYVEIGIKTPSQAARIMTFKLDKNGLLYQAS